MTTSSRSILLTGGAGFIGSHVAEALLARGAQLTVVDNLDDFYPPAWKRANLEGIRRQGAFDFVAADICDSDALRETFARVRPEAVIHLAARAGVRPSIEQPMLYERVNVAGTLHLLELAREYNVPRFVFGSSSSVYGASARVPFSEEHLELRPISPYAATKLAGEMLAHTYAHLYKVKVTCLRFFTVYGPRQRPDLAIHKFTSLIERGEPLPIYGDGSSGRDYTYVDDIVAGVLAALDYSPRNSEGVPFEIFNIGNSHPVPLNELVKALETVAGRKATRHTLPAQAGDVPLTWADISRAKRLLNYQPSTKLKTGLENFVRWYRATDAARKA